MEKPWKMWSSWRKFLDHSLRNTPTLYAQIEESKDTDKMSIDELHSSLIVHEQKFIKNKGEEHALKAATQERGEFSS